MEILTNKSNLPKHVSLILGFFDGIHAGHRNVIANTPEAKKVIVTFASSPAEYFNKHADYIYSRNYNYELIKNLNVDYIYELNFADIVNMTASSYLEMLKEKFNPISITTGFNHTFGANCTGNPEFLRNNQDGFEYFCTPPTIIDDEIVSSTKIKELLKLGDITKANKFLTKNFTLTSKVIEGAKIGRTLGFPTANMQYPQKIIKLSYGVYKVKVLDRLAIMNWGTKPTIGAKEILEVHIPNFEGDLYGKNLDVEILSKIRDEQKFNSLDDLKTQIERDILCLEL